MFYVVAARLLESGSVTFKGHTLLISAPGQSPDTSGTQPDISEPLHRTDTIKVSSVDPFSVSKDMLSMYFENFRRSRGGDIKRLDLVPEKKKAFITFKDPSGALCCLTVCDVLLTSCDGDSWFVFNVSVSVFLCQTKKWFL